MQNKKQALSIAENAIHRLIESLHRLFLLGTLTKEKIEERKEKRDELDKNNPDYAEVRHDKRENMKMYWQLLLILASMAIDFILVYQPMDIICSTYNWPFMLKFLVPVFLIVLEIGIAYFQTLQHRNAEHANWFIRNLQYLVIVILFAFSVVLILFSVNSYNAEIDTISFWGFVTGTVLVQMGLLCASIMLHVWLIRNAETLSETIGYFMYRYARVVLSSSIQKFEKEIKEKHTPEFKKGCQNLVHKIELFKREFPHADVCFDRAIPGELMEAINKAMGKTIFSIEAENIA